MNNNFVNNNQRENDNRSMDMELKNNSEGWDPEALKKDKNWKIQKNNDYHKILKLFNINELNADIVFW